jgi:hypothetical protein
MFTVNILRFVDSNIYTNMISVILTDFCFCFFASDMLTVIKKNKKRSYLIIENNNNIFVRID